MNAMDAEAYQGLLGIFRELESDREVRAVVLTAAGERIFTAGGDMKAYARRSDEDWQGEGLGSGAPAYVAELNEVMWNLRKPLVLAANGSVVGWGIMAAFSSDYRITVPHAKFGYAGAISAFGAAEGGGVIERLLVQIPYVHAMELLLSGAFITAEQAHRFHLVNEVVAPDQLQARAREVAERFVAMPPLAIQNVKASVKRVYNQQLDGPIETSNATGRMYLYTRDFREALDAFAEKRQPVWSGR
ncbi:enoyl-CoA hydratase-related protein [Nocardioides sp. TF02-7]|nr:enoyl-CoA hydratase-related protein [Nocardioides sp. TF02-7]